MAYTPGMGAAYMGPAQNTNTTVSTRSGSTYSNQQVQGTTRKYIDVPSPEEFLDDFENAFTTHLMNQVQAGGITMQAAQWALSHPQNFLSQYTARLGQMAQAGQQIFKGYLPQGDPNYLGTRQGDITTRQTVGSGGGTTTSVSTDNSAPQRTAAGAAAVSAAPYTPNAMGAASTGGAASAGAGANVTGSGTHGMGAAPTGTGGPGGGNTQQNTTTQNTNTNDYSSLNEQEDVYSRPKATYLHTLAPGDFLNQNFGADALNLEYEGNKGFSSYRQTRAMGSGTRILS